jgi:hypothetical protein
MQLIYSNVLPTQPGWYWVRDNEGGASVFYLCVDSDQFPPDGHQNEQYEQYLEFESISEHLLNDGWLVAGPIELPVLPRSPQEKQEAREREIKRLIQFYNITPEGARILAEATDRPISNIEIGEIVAKYKVKPK